jgi:hypothetical protein
LLYSNIRSVIVLPSQPMNIPGEFLYIAILYLIMLIINLAPAYYIRFKHYSYLSNYYCHDSPLDEYRFHRRGH